MGARTRADLIHDLYGVDCQTNLGGLTDTVGASATQLLRIGPNRLALTIVNNSATTVYVHPTNDVSSSLGVVLAAGGGNLELNWRDDFDVVGLEWWAVAAVAGAKVTIYEVVAR